MDLDGFDRAILIYMFHQKTGWTPTVIPYLDTSSHGLFATRAPRRPNPIGISVVQLLDITDGILTIEDVDLLNQTPLLKIKPYIPAFYSYPDSRAGWRRHSTGLRVPGQMTGFTWNNYLFP